MTEMRVARPAEMPRYNDTAPRPILGNEISQNSRHSPPIHEKGKYVTTRRTKRERTNCLNEPKVTLLFDSLCQFFGSISTSDEVEEILRKQILNFDNKFCNKIDSKKRFPKFWFQGFRHIICQLLRRNKAPSSVCYHLVKIMYL